MQLNFNMIFNNNTIDVSIIDKDIDLISDMVTEFSNHKSLNLRWGGADVQHFFQNGISKTDVLLLDIMMDDILGSDLIESLKAANSSMLIIIFTVVEEEDILFQSIRRGADGYILKGLPFEDLVKSIQSTYSGGANISPIMARKMFNYFNHKVASNYENLLSKNEYQVLKFLSEGHSYKLISQKLDISLDSVRYYIKGVYKKLNVNSKGEAILKFLSAN